jgi:hypothetical protein
MTLKKPCGKEWGLFRQRPTHCVGNHRLRVTEVDRLGAVLPPAKFYVARERRPVARFSPGPRPHPSFIVRREDWARGSGTPEAFRPQSTTPLFLRLAGKTETNLVNSPVQEEAHNSPLFNVFGGKTPCHTAVLSIPAWAALSTDSE